MSMHSQSREPIADSMPTDRFLREPEVLQQIGISKMTLRRWELNGRFPRRYRIGPNTVVWKESEVTAWIANPLLSSLQPKRRGTD